jgi:hypothetical protein
VHPNMARHPPTVDLVLLFTPILRLIRIKQYNGLLVRGFDEDNTHLGFGADAARSLLLTLFEPFLFEEDFDGYMFCVLCDASDAC